MTKEYTHAVVIGRFQPFHNVHKDMVERAFDLADNVVVIVGSSRVAPNIKNPFTFETRKWMIESCFPGIVDGKTTEYHNRLKVLPVRDYYYDDDIWTANVNNLVGAKQGDSVVLVGHYKDATSYYLNHLNWEFKPFKSNSNLDATQIRDVYFDVHHWSDWEGKAKLDLKLVISQDQIIDKLVPSHVAHYLKEFKQNPKYLNLIEEYKEIKRYKHSWRNVPFPPVFVTSDAIVTCAGHVLVVKRKDHPGKGLLAVPGGFIKTTETTQRAAVRELIEETRIRLSVNMLTQAIVEEKVFDYPHRSLRGRIITHAFHIDLPGKDLPEVEGADDALEAFWMPRMDVLGNEDLFYEDHAQIINYFNTKRN